MTIPTMMNCPHSGDGWCLACVQKLQNTNEDLKLRNHLLRDRTDLPIERLKSYDTIINIIDAVRYHRDQKGDDRCWMDDEKLYQSLPEGYTPPERDVAVELKFCEQYIKCRRNPKTVYVSPNRRIEELSEALYKILKIINTTRYEMADDGDRIEALIQEAFKGYKVSPDPLQMENKNEKNEKQDGQGH